MAAEVDDVATCRRAHPPLAKVTDDYRRGNHAMIAEARGAESNGDLSSLWH